MQILVLYHSRTGNTETLARSIARGVDEVEGVKAKLRSTADVTTEDFKESRGVIAGSPVYFGGMAAELKKVFDDFIKIRKSMEGKIGAAFTTSAHITGGKETTIMGILRAMLIYGMVVVGDPYETGGHFGIACKGEPDDKAAHDGAALGRRVADLTKRFAACR